MFLYREDGGESFEGMIHEFIKNKKDDMNINFYGKTGMINENIAFYQEDIYDTEFDKDIEEDDIEEINKYLEKKYQDSNLYFNIPESFDIDEIEYLTNDMDYMKSLTGESYQNIYPYVIEVLNEYEFQGCPMFIEGMDNSFIDTVVKKIISRAAAHIKEVKEIEKERTNGLWGRKELLRSFVRMCVLSELFGCRRPNYRRILKNEFVK